MNECKVCGNAPDANGWLTHSKGCYVLSEEGGGEEYIEGDEIDAHESPVELWRD